MLLDTPTLTIEYSPGNQLLRVHWIGHHTTQSVYHDCLKMLGYVQQTRCTKILNDSSEAFGEWLDLAEWIGKEFIPQLADSGVLALAWVNAMDWPSRHAVARSVQHARGLLIHTFDFDEREAAARWLDSLAR
ncbi:hypothetical protein [Hymenobacter sp. UYP22]|uniref:hypothetical protein n=1 Tax=Hymenobacter sp. UYP22 TaxID=3156348 RepID=UPI003395C255